MLVAYVGGAPNFFPTFDIEIPYLMPFGTYAIPIYALATTYAIVRYRLMDINVAVTRTAVFGGVYALVLGMPLAGALAWQARLEQWLGAKWWVGLWVVVAALATVAHYVNLFFQRKAAARLLREQHRYQATLLQASHGMTQIRELKRLLSMIVHVITRTVGLTHAEIFLLDQKEDAYVLLASRYQKDARSIDRLPTPDPLIKLLNRVRQPIVMEELRAQLIGVVPRTPEEVDRALAFSRMEAMRAGVTVPSFMQEELIGFVVLGEKRNQRVFTSDDLNVFATLANQAALAIENAHFFEEMKTQEAFLIQSEKMASLGQLASGMAHEIHNPLAIISGESQLYLEQHRGEGQGMEALLNSIIQECNRAADITRRILRFARPGKTDFGPVDLQAVIEEGFVLVRYRVRLERVNCQLAFPPDLPKVLGQYNQLQEVFLNLILNACQAMGEQGGRLEIAAEGVGEQVEVRVTDSGPGIPREKLSKLFDPFYTTKHNGTGLGLFVSHRIIRAHNGSITVRSAEGKGTTFTIRLPTFRETTQPLSNSYEVR